MALETGASTAFSGISATGIELQSSDEGANVDEAQSLNASGGVNEFHSYNERKEPTAEYEIGLNDSANSVSVSIDLGSSDGNILITGVNITLNNTAYPRLTLNGFNPENGTIEGTSFYTLDVSDLYFGAHTTMGALSDTTDLQTCTIAASAITRIECRDGDGNHKESKIEAVRLDVNGTILADSAPSLLGDWKGPTPWTTTENQGYKLFNFRAFKLESCSAV